MFVSMMKVMNASPMMSSSSSFPSNPVSAVPTSSPPSTNLPVSSIPGSYGWPVVGPLSDRLDYFWFQGPETFFRKRMEKHNSTVFRTNVPPTFPFFTVNPNAIAVLDVKSFSHLFDMELVEKRDVLVGNYMPSTSFTGGIRVGVYLDPSEPQHAKVKNFSMDLLKQSSKIWIKELVAKLDKLCDTLETELTEADSASYPIPLQKCIFNFLTTTLLGADPTTTSPEIASKGYAMLDRWLALQLLPTIKIGILQPLEEIFLHSFAYPFALVSNDYRKLSDFIRQHGKSVLERGETEFNLSQEETIHHLLFVLGFNAFGGFSIFLISLFGTIAGDEVGLQEKVKKEVREHCGSGLTFESVNKLELVKSLVYETLRLNPPVPLQFARARKDFRLSSHDAVYEIKKGELLCGYQPLVMRDEKVYEEPEKFKAERFMGKGSELLQYLYWSNGPQTGTPTESNKQCSAKEYVPLTACLVVAYLFLRYDKITGNSSSITGLVKAK